MMPSEARLNIFLTAIKYLFTTYVPQTIIYFTKIYSENIYFKNAIVACLTV